MSLLNLAGRRGGFLLFRYFPDTTTDKLPPGTRIKAHGPGGNLLAQAVIGRTPDPRLVKVTGQQFDRITMTDSPTEPPPTKPRAHHYELRIRHLGRARWDWVFKADNGRTLAKSSEEYRRRRTAEHGARVTLGIEPDNREAFRDGEIVHRGTDPVPVRIRLR